MPFPDSPDVEGNRRRAFMKDWLEKHPQRVQLANQGDAVAQCEMGRHLFFKMGNQSGSASVSYDEKVEAVKWYRKAADQGYVDALFDLGNCYNFGDGVPKDCVEAYAYMSLIIDVHQYARSSRDNLARYLPEIVARGEHRAKELLKEYDVKWPSD
jgi:TPR repeat protein